MKQIYTEIHYPKTEHNLSDYPNKLCHYLVNKYFWHVKSKKLLDIGLGVGNHALAFRRLGLKVYGIDKEKSTTSLPSDIRIKCCDLDKEPIPFKTNFFDYIFTKSVIEHISNTDNFFTEIYRILKPNGIVIIMTPDWQSQLYDFYDDHTHITPFTRKGLQIALKLYDFKDVQVNKFYQLPFIWKYPFLSFIPKIISLLPNNFKWVNKEQTQHRKLIRFSKELMLIGIARK